MAKFPLPVVQASFLHGCLHMKLAPGELAGGLPAPFQLNRGPKADPAPFRGAGFKQNRVRDSKRGGGKPSSHQDLEMLSLVGMT